MKKRILLLVLSIVLCMICGCAETPSEVITDMENYHDTNKVEQIEKESYDMIHVNELNNEIQNALKKQYGQFHLSPSISCSAPSSIETITLQIMDDFGMNYEDIFLNFFSKKELANQNIENKTIVSSYTVNGHKYNGKYSTTSHSFQNENEKTLGVVNNLGHICIIKPSAYDSPFNNTDETIKVYHIDRGEDLTDSYSLIDGTITVSDAVDYVNTFLEQFIDKYEPTFLHKVKTVIVKRNDNTHYLRMIIEKSYKDVALDSYTAVWETDKNERNFLRFVHTEYEISMYHKNAIDCFTTGGSLFNIESSESVSECISLESALLHCQAKFADFQDITISDINIMYTLSPEYDYIGEEITEDDGTKVNLNQPYPSANIKIHSRPVWEFAIDVSPTEYLQQGEVNTKGDIHKYIYVDMLTGELYYQLDLDNL